MLGSSLRLGVTRRAGTAGHDLFNLLAMNPKSAHRAITPIAKKSTSASPSPTPKCCTACTGCTRKAMMAKTRNSIPIFFTPVLFSWLPFSCAQHHVSSRAHNHGGGKGGEEGQWICTWPTVVKVSINACKKGSTSCSWLSNAQSPSYQDIIVANWNLLQQYIASSLFCERRWMYVSNVQ